MKVRRRIGEDPYFKETGGNRRGVKGGNSMRMEKFEKEFGPLIVSIDTEGRNLFEENKVIFNERKEKAIEEICKHVSFIK